MPELSELLKHMSPDVRDANPDLFPDTGVQQPQPKASRSTLEERFLSEWEQITDRELEQEYKFHPDRQWRFDFAHPYTRTAIELEGGVWSQGRHVRGQGFIDDCIKYNEAGMQGWTVFRLPAELITWQYVNRIHQHISMESE